MKEFLLTTIPRSASAPDGLVGVLLNQNDMNRLDGRINVPDARIDGLDGRINALSKPIPNGIVMLVGCDTDKVGCLARA